MILTDWLLSPGRRLWPTFHSTGKTWVRCPYMTEWMHLAKIIENNLYENKEKFTFPTLLNSWIINQDLGETLKPAYEGASGAGAWPFCSPPVMLAPLAGPLQEKLTDAACEVAFQMALATDSQVWPFLQENLPQPSPVEVLKFLILLLLLQLCKAVFVIMLETERALQLPCDQNEFPNPLLPLLGLVHTCIYWWYASHYVLRILKLSFYISFCIWKSDY